MLAGLVLVLLTSACSRVTLFYNTADFFAKRYAREYLDLGSDQISRWEPRLDAALARHRAQELPHLAAFVDQALKASRLGFDATNMACLTKEFRGLYRRHAQLAVDLSAPLLADLTPSQLDTLEAKFNREAAEDKAGLAERDTAREKRKRAERYLESIEDWSGELSAHQRAIVADVTARMPDSEPAIVAYRTRKRQELITLLRQGASEARIRAFLSAWLVDFDDLPSELKRAGDLIEARISELFIRLGRSFDRRQRDHLDTRLRHLRDDLMKLQKAPRMAPLDC